MTVTTRRSGYPHGPPVDDCRRSSPDDWARWLIHEQHFIPRQRLTLTFDLKRQAVSVEGALWYWRRLVQWLNEREGGRAYRDKWGHSWFSYVVGVEYHKSGAVHLEAVTDANLLPYAAIHQWWQGMCGWAWLHPVDDGLAALRYALKYVVKSDQAPAVWIQRLPRNNSVIRLQQDEPCLPSGDPAGSLAPVKAARLRASGGRAVCGPALTGDSAGEGLERQARLL